MTCSRFIRVMCNKLEIHGSETSGIPLCRNSYDVACLTQGEARKDANKHGWSVLDGLDYCPKHASLGES